MKRLLQALGLRKRHHVFPDAKRYTINVKSSLDGTTQPSLFIPANSRTPAPLLVFLHPWRHSYDYDCRPWLREAQTRGWHFLAPDFRGPNKRPEACASKLARRDVLDAVDAVCARAAIDRSRVYVGGCSGGAHMALVMAAEAPERWAAVSAWSAISDLATFYNESVRDDAKVYRHIVNVAGGAPGSSPAVDAELKFRSPRFFLASAASLAVDINHGIHDGVPRGVGIQHSVWAFNEIAKANGTVQIEGEELQRLLRQEYVDADRVDDATYGRAIYFRRSAGASRITLFEGGHEDLPGAACAWLAGHARANVT